MSELSRDPDGPQTWSSDYFRDATAAPGVASTDRGLLDHVPIVAVLLMIQGGLEILLAFCGGAFILLTFFGPEKEFAAMRGLGIVFAVIGATSLVAGVLRLVAGLLNLKFRGRRLGMVALAAGLLTLVTGYCAPSSIALAIYGLIVYFNEPVVLAFRMGDRGRTAREIRSAFPPRA
jgi:hypothetical protein